MKIRELKELLSGYDPELEVVLSKDEEGNSFLPCAVGDEYYAFPDGRHYDVVADEDVGTEYELDDPQLVKIFVLWP